MKKLLTYSLAVMFLAFQSCQQSMEAPSDQVPQDILKMIVDSGFDINNIAPTAFEDGYLIEGDIYLTRSDLKNLGQGMTLGIPTEEQYHTNNLVTAGGGRVITVYISAADQTANSTVNKAKGGNGGGGKPGGGGSAQFPAEYGYALNDAIARYNSENLSLTFSRVNSASGADIVYTRLAKGDERRGILGSAGFPTSAGDPHGEIKMSGIIQSTYGWSTEAIATVMSHEMGHCVGFRHTDYFDRSVSCGGGTSNEGDAGIGANHIPGTPTGASLSAASFMLACTGGGDRPFNGDDKVALDYLY